MSAPLQSGHCLIVVALLSLSAGSADAQPGRPIRAVEQLDAVDEIHARDCRRTAVGRARNSQPKLPTPRT